VHETAPRWSPARLAYWFYAVAAAGAAIGQTWVALTHVPWSAGVPAWVRVAAVLPFALCLELLAMALAAMADERLRLGEHAHGFRVFSALVATVAVGILVIGHWPHHYWSAAFGALSSSAYLLWLLHSAARRRDALRAAGKLADTAPDYGLWRRLRYPIRTARAAEAAREGRVDETTGQWRPLQLYESLRVAQLAMRAEKRRPAVANAVERVVRSDHGDPRMADIAVRTLDLDRLAAELERLVDYPAWADRLAPAVTVPAITMETRTTAIDSAVPAPQLTTSPPGLAIRPRRVARQLRVSVRRRRLDATRIAPTPATPQAPLTGATVDSNAAEAIVRPVDNETHTDAGEDPEATSATGGFDGAPRAHPVGPASTAAEDQADVPAPTSRRLPEPDMVAEQPPSAVESQLPDEANKDAPTNSATPRSETAAAVAYWRDRHPNLRPSEIAVRIGRSKRQVQRILATLDHPEPLSRPNGASVDDLADAHR